MPINNTRQRTRVNDIWTYDTSDAGSGTTGATTCVHIQVNKTKKRKWKVRNVFTTGCLWITYVVSVTARGTRLESAVPRLLACNSSESPDIPMTMSVDNFDQMYI